MQNSSPKFYPEKVWIELFSSAFSEGSAARDCVAILGQRFRDELCSLSQNTPRGEIDFVFGKIEALSKIEELANMPRERKNNAKITLD